MKAILIPLLEDAILVLVEVETDEVRKVRMLRRAAATLKWSKRNGFGTDLRTRPNCSKACSTS